MVSSWIGTGNFGGSENYGRRGENWIFFVDRDGFLNGEVDKWCGGWIMEVWWYLFLIPPRKT